MPIQQEQVGALLADVEELQSALAIKDAQLVMLAQAVKKESAEIERMARSLEEIKAMAAYVNVQDTHSKREAGEAALAAARVKLTEMRKRQRLVQNLKNDQHDSKWCSLVPVDLKLPYLLQQLSAAAATVVIHVGTVRAGNPWPTNGPWSLQPNRTPI